MLDVQTIFDSLAVYCPSLGHRLQFEYCRRANSGAPCRRALVCWEALFPVGKYMELVLTREEWQTIFTEPAPTRWDAILKAAAEANSVQEADSQASVNAKPPTK
ncbi:MAG: hypothetical protein HQK55_07855 [Deltaproteobacteria bacterium]|nr:hypothetical protein [Deltaproteobacteria bacterium]